MCLGPEARRSRMSHCKLRRPSRGLLTCCLPVGMAFNCKSSICIDLTWRRVCVCAVTRLCCLGYDFATSSCELWSTLGSAFSRFAPHCSTGDQSAARHETRRVSLARCNLALGNLCRPRPASTDFTLFIPMRANSFCVFCDCRKVHSLCECFCAPFVE